MTALVTGGGGFLGGAIVRKLVERGDAVRSLSRTRHTWLDQLEVEQFEGDLAGGPAIGKAIDGCDVVFHVAAKAGVWGSAYDYGQTNSCGTMRIISRCLQYAVPRLVYTSTPSVVHTGHSNEGANESLPYATHFLAEYPRSKTVAEKNVLNYNNKDLSTVALRPHLIWGNGDPHLIPRVLQRARAGKLRRIGSHPIMVDVTHVENAAHAHILAADKLEPGSPIAGNAYFISDGQPVELWEFLNRILTDNGLSPVTKSVPVWQAKLAGYVLEKLHKAFRPNVEPAMTRFVASQLSTSHWYDISAARRDLGYEPIISTEEGLRRLARA